MFMKWGTESYEVVFIQTSNALGEYFPTETSISSPSGSVGSPGYFHFCFHVIYTSLVLCLCTK